MAILQSAISPDKQKHINIAYRDFGNQT